MDFVNTIKSMYTTSYFSDSENIFFIFHRTKNYVKYVTYPTKAMESNSRMNKVLRMRYAFNQDVFCFSTTEFFLFYTRTV